MSSQRKPPYVLNGDRLPSSLVPKILGRIIANPLFPQDNSLPKDPGLEVNSEHYSEVVDPNVDRIIRAKIGHGVEVRLLNLANLGVKKEKSNVSEMCCSTLIFFTALYAKHQEAIIDMLNSEHRKGLAYIAVAIKSYVDGEVEAQRGSIHCRNSIEGGQLTVGFRN